MSGRPLWVLDAASSTSGNTALTPSRIRSHQRHQDGALQQGRDAVQAARLLDLQDVPGPMYRK